MQRRFDRLTEQSFDVLILGGGIYGAWTAYNAALRGLRVALVEKDDWAGGTSSASSKLIHGGLRYLESFNIRLVRKSLQERQMLLRAAPHRVQPLLFGIPAYTHQRIKPWQFKAGLMLYDYLAGIHKTEWGHESYCAEDFLQRFPFLEPKGLQKGYHYIDAQTDDARFALEIVAGALKAGAVCLNYCEARHLCEKQGRLRGAEVIDRVSGKTAEIQARCIVNATGQWLGRFIEQPKALYRLSKGVHLVMPKVLENKAVLLLARADGRVFFLIPWYGLTLLGTTDTDYHGDPDRVGVDETDIDYLLNEANQALAAVNWRQDDIIGRFAGLRVLKTGPAVSPSALSRDWELREMPNGLLVSIGGKFTSARENAAQIVDRICRKLDIPRACSTYGRAFPWTPQEPFEQWSAAIEAQGRRLGLTAEILHWLIFRHGRKVTEIFRLIEQKPALKQRIAPELPFIEADLIHCAQQEMAIRLEDILRRRMPLLILKKLTRSDLKKLADKVGDALGWHHERTRQEFENCAEQWEIH